MTTHFRSETGSLKLSKLTKVWKRLRYIIEYKCINIYCAAFCSAKKIPNVAFCSAFFELQNCRGTAYWVILLNKK